MACLMINYVTYLTDAGRSIGGQGLMLRVEFFEKKVVQRYV